MNVGPHKPLERSSVEAYVATALAIISVVFAMTWWLKVVFLIVLAAIGVDLLCRSPLTLRVRVPIKLVLSLGVAVLVAWLAWRPLQEQRAAENVGAKFGDSFYAVAEAKVASAGTGNSITGYWLASQGNGACAVSPVTLMLFLRIINLKSNPSLITGYSVAVRDSDGRWQNLTRLDARTGYVLWTSPKPAGPFKIGQPIQLPEGSYRVNQDPATLDMQHAAVSRLEKLDDVVGDHPISPKQWVRGWAMFQHKGNADLMRELQLTIKDELNEEHTLVLPEVSPYLNSDVMAQLWTVSGEMDVSSCKHAPYPY